MPDPHLPEDTLTSVVQEVIRALQTALDDAKPGSNAGPEIMFWRTGVVAVTMLILGGLRYITSGVDAAGAATTRADLQALVIELRTAVREFERQRAENIAAAQASALALASYRWAVASGWAAIIGALIALLALLQDRIEADQPDPPPAVTVVVERPDPAEIARIVDEQLRERERQAEHDGADPDLQGQDQRGTHG